MSDVTTEDEILRGRYTYSQVKQDALEGNLLVTWSRNIGKHFATASAGVSKCCVWIYRPRIWWK